MARDTKNSTLLLGLIKNTFSSWSNEIARIIYPRFVRPRLEFASSVWNPHLEYDSKTLESVQRRATLTKESHHLPSEKRMERQGLTDLKTRRERGDFQDCARSREGKLVRWKHNTKTRAKYNSPKTLISGLSWAYQRKRAENTLPSQQNGDPLEKFAQRHCTCTLGELFQELAGLVLEQS